MRKYILGVDPGVSGGLAIIQPDGLAVAFSLSNMTERDIYDVFSAVVLENTCMAYLEKVHAMPGQGVTSMFSFGQNYGFLRGVLVATHTPFIEVTPQAWQKKLGLGGLSPERSQRKKLLKQKAQQLFPYLKVTLATADALLIAQYGLVSQN